nr:hypothetical protein [Tanacetum cinerariifolium]
MEISKRGSIPMKEKLRLSKSQGASTLVELNRMQNVPYALVVGLLCDIKRELRVSCYTDVGYLTDADDLKSQTGYVFILKRGVFDWKSTKQSIIVRKFIYGLGVVPIIEEPINMYCDNTRAITIANESGITNGAKHFRTKVHYLREVIEYGDIKQEKVHTDENFVDPFTKSLAFPKHS